MQFGYYQLIWRINPPLVAPHHPYPSPYRSACGIGKASKKLSKMAGNLATVQLNLNFTHMCRYTRVLAYLTHEKLQKLSHARTVAHNFGVCMRDSKYT